MLTRQQWLWLADHHEQVRSWSIRALVFAAIIYTGMIVKITWEKGKAPIPYKAATDFRGQFNCKEKLTPFDMGPFGGNTPSKPGFYEDARPLLFERHYTEMLDVEGLIHYPECIGAFLADTVESPNPTVFLLYDQQKGRVVYRIARIDDALKR